MTLVPTVFPEQAEAVIASYNYTDIAEGTGIIVLYCSELINDTGTTYSLNQNALYTQNKFTNAVVPASTSSWTKFIDLDFDLPSFNLPKNIAGTFIVKGISNFSNLGSGTQGTYMVAKIRKWDGTTETEIAEATSVTIANTATQPARIWKGTIPITHFKKGEILRLTIEGWAMNTNAGTPSNITIYYDPEDTADLDLKLYMPFRITL